MVRSTVVGRITSQIVRNKNPVNSSGNNDTNNNSMMLTKDALGFVRMTMRVERVDATFVKIEVAMLALKALQSSDSPQKAFTLFAFGFHGVLVRLK